MIISNPGSIWSLKRRFLAQEFGIKHVSVPTPYTLNPKPYSLNPTT